MGQKGDANVEVVRNSDLVTAIYSVQAGKFRRFHSLTLLQNIFNFRVNLLNLRDVLFIMIGFFESFSLLIRHRPDVIFFKGGFVVVPIGFAARMLRIPYMTHDSDPIPGLANRLIAKGAKKNAVVSGAVTPYSKGKMIVTGVPLTREYSDRRGAKQAPYKQKLGFPTDCLLLFVYTGTQGARIVDDAMEEALPELLANYPKLQIAYVFGRLNEASMTDRFSDLSKSEEDRISKLTFVSNAYDYIAASDIIVARAGATSMAEFAAIGRASILVPAEQLTGGHQLMNAKIYADRHAAVIVREKDLASGELLGAIRLLIDEPDTRHKLELSIQKLAPDNASRTIAEELVSITNKTR